MASWGKCELSYETIHKLCELFAFKSLVAETAIHIKSPVNSWYFQALFFAFCQCLDYKAFLHWWVFQSYPCQRGLLCVKLIHKKFNRSISYSKVKLFYLGTDVPRSYPGCEVNFKKCLKRLLNFSVIFKSDLGTSLMGSSTHLYLCPFKFWTRFGWHVPLDRLEPGIVTESRPLCSNSLVWTVKEEHPCGLCW